MKTCPACKETKPLQLFYTRVSNGKEYPSSWCRDCKKARAQSFPRKRCKEKERQYNATAEAKRKESRKVEANRASILLYDCKKSDRKKGLKCDLDLGFVESAIKLPCFYCEDPNPECMTLDRTDNSIGHLKTNVVQSCYRCNFARGSMPIEAWNYLRSGMKSARLAGAFSGWRERPITRKY